MQWNEKIQHIKLRFTADEFSVPVVGRKKILKQIESAFIKRPAAYYDLNTYQGPFRQWWTCMRFDEERCVHVNELQTVMTTFDDRQDLWIGCEFKDGTVWLYRARPKSATDLMMSGLTWANTYHLISTDFSLMVGLQFSGTQLHVKKKQGDG
jgi:hypothetical protein